ncbi:MAG: cyclodeaminase/cyclohydrolase family protein [Peptococcaceae bacterium]|nr:cyclodeaminase/cyclohydrolase family protein [Peptococcaceae bacterium]
MKQLEQSAVEFLAALSSSAPAPGGGGASALTGALAAALGMMVSNLTIGKEKYAEHEEALIGLRAELEALRDKLVGLVDADAEGFLPLARAYGIPKDDPSRERVMEEALATACLAPFEMMTTAYAVLCALAALVKKGSRLAVSDVGAGAVLAQAAIEAAALNIRINTKSMQDRARANQLNERADTIIREGSAYKERIYLETLKVIG